MTTAVRPLASDDAQRERIDEAERALLGALIVENDLLDAIAPRLEHVDFVRWHHAAIYRRMVDLRAAGAPIDLITLRQALAATGELDEVGVSYLSRLIDGIPRSMNVEYHARTVRIASKARQALAYCHQAIATFNADPLALGNGAGLRFSAVIETLVDEAHADSDPAGERLLIDDRELLTMKPPAMFVDGALVANSLIGLVGPPGSGKTHAAIGLCFAAITRGHWLGFEVLEPGAAIYVSGEGVLQGRVRAWKSYLGLPLTEAAGFYLHQGAVNLLDSRAVHRLIAASRGLQPSIVVLDTLARNMAGGDENSSGDMGRVIEAADRIRVETGAAVMFLHHMTKGGGVERGSSALRGALDTLMVMNPTDDLLTLTCEKQKDLPPFAPVSLKLEPYEGSCVVRLAHQASTSKDLSPTQRRCLTVLRESFQAANGATSTEWQRAAADVVERAFYRAKAVLIDAGCVRLSRGKHLLTDKGLALSNCHSTDSLTDKPTDKQPVIAFPQHFEELTSPDNLPDSPPDTQFGSPLGESRTCQ